MVTARSGETYMAGGVAEAGSYKCRDCGLRIGIDHLEEVPSCPACGGSSFRRAPLFQAARALSPPTTEQELVPGPTEPPEWLGATRELLADGESYMVFDDAGIRVVRLAAGWSRIGRSATSDIRLDDPTVSRRHALLVRTSGGEVRVLDDRSLNGVRLNGDLVEWGTLADGDELAIGRFRLYLVALEPAGSGTSAPPSA
ncbi:MAG TPA: FHA domain-containing protein [Solirubrobacterales bacterium]